MAATFIVLGITVVVFISNKLRPDFVALLSSLALFFIGVLDGRQIFAGFSDPTVTMIAGLLVVSSGLSRSGVTAWLGHQLLVFCGDSDRRVLFVLMAGTAVFSGFLSNTGIVAMLLPAAMLIARKLRLSPSRLLLPLAFAANTGGLLTMIGTPPNVVVVNALEKEGLVAFQFFEFALLGIPLLLVLVAYMLVFGAGVLPDRKSAEDNSASTPEPSELSETYGLGSMFFQVTIADSSPSQEKTLKELGLGSVYGIDVLFIDHSESESVRSDAVHLPGPGEMLEAGDVLLVRSSEEALSECAEELGFTFSTVEKGSPFSEKLLAPHIDLIEVIIPPRSSVIGKTIADARRHPREIAQVVAVRRGTETLRDLSALRLACGDVLLIRADHKNLAATGERPGDYLLLSHWQGGAVELTGKSWFAMGALLVMVVLMLFRLVPSSVAALVAACLMIMGGCLNLNQAYRHMNWQSIVLIAAMIPMSTALQVTGGAEFMALKLVTTLGQYDPIWLLAGIFIITSAFSQVMSNTATTILITPIVLRTATELELSPYPFFMAVAVAASTAFLTPIGTTTNVMVMTPGRYTFADYIRCGAPILLLFLVVSVVFIPLIWPF